MQTESNSVGIMSPSSPLITPLSCVLTMSLLRSWSLEFLPFSVQLPILQMVAPIMQVYASIAVAAFAGLLVLEEKTF